MLRASWKLISRMPVTRSKTRSVATAAVANLSTPESSVTKPKRKASTASSPAKSVQKKPRVNDATAQDVMPPPALQVSSALASIPDEAVLVPAVLSFNFEEAKKHLIGVDHRFEDIFSRMTCKPFEILERCISYIHSWATVAIYLSFNKDLYLIDLFISESLGWQLGLSTTGSSDFTTLQSLRIMLTTPSEIKSATSFFPSPVQVAQTDIATLRTAGLSARKAEYVQDLASRFADGRLSTQKLIDADDVELAEMLIEVRGIGRWTVDMFAIFSLRRPDILPVGDLGVQRGLVRWFLSLHSSSHSFSLSPEKGGGASPKKKKTAKKIEPDDDVLPVFGQVSTIQDAGITDPKLATDTLSSDVSSVPPAPISTISSLSSELPSMPALFTPSINRTLNMPESDPVALPEGLTVAVLKSRLDGKKIKGAFLTPKEMEDLTAAWRPYRSIGIYYMWSLADGDAQ